MRLFSDSASAVDDPMLGHAYALATRGFGLTSPNPAVGCVIARGGRIVGEGYHAMAGGPHAEALALLDAGEDARGATAYVTLEPCGHHGRTPPCAEALIQAGVARVVIGMSDPNAEAAGGAKTLAAAGIEVSFSDTPELFAELNEGWLKRIATGRPFVSVKVAMSLDGRIALRQGARSAITGPSGSKVTGRLRRSSDAILVGGATVIADDPALLRTDALGDVDARQPLRVVLVGSEPLPDQGKLFTDGAADTLLCVPDHVPVPDGLMGPRVSVATYAAAEGFIGVLRILGERGVNELLVEPGRRLLTALVDGGHIDRLVTVTAGGFGGLCALEVYSGAGDAGADSLRHLFSPQEAGIVGDVVAVSWRPDGTRGANGAAAG